MSKYSWYNVKPHFSSSGAPDGPADQETPAGGVWRCSRGEGPDDHCASDSSMCYFILPIFHVNRGDTEAVCLQVSLLKKRLQASGGMVSSEGETSQSTDAVDAASDIQSPSKDDSSTLNTGVCRLSSAHVTCFYTKLSLTSLFAFCVCGQQRAVESQAARWTSSCFRRESKGKRVSCRDVKRWFALVKSAPLSWAARTRFYSSSCRKGCKSLRKWRYRKTKWHNWRTSSFCTSVFYLSEFGQGFISWCISFT